MSSSGPDPTPRRVGLGVAAAVALFFVERVVRAPVQGYGVTGAWYIEHVQRLRVVRALGELLDGGALAALDGAFPPGMHLVGAAWGAVVGHQAEAMLWLGLPWLALLAGAVAMLARRFAGPSAGWYAAAALLLLPPITGAATRYYYDLPMTALIWAAMAALATGAGWRSGLLAGALLCAACLVKWPALVLGPPMLLGVALAQRPRGVAAARLTLALVVVGATVGGYLLLAGPRSSLATMLDQMWGQGARANTVDVGAALARTVGGLDPVAAGQRLLWYGVSLLGPTVGGAWLAVAATARPARAPLGVGLVCAAALAVHAAFLGLAVPVVDERFLLTGLPCAALLVGTSVRPGRLAGAALAFALLVSAEFHLGLPLPGARLQVQPVESMPALILRFPWHGDSVEDRGWVGRRRQAPHHAATRRATWQAVLDCGPSLLVAGRPDQGFGPGSEIDWLDYRRRLAAQRGEPAPYDVIEDCPRFDEPYLLLQGEPGSAPQDVPACHRNQPLRLRQRVAVSDEVQVAVWEVGERPCGGPPPGTPESSQRAGENERAKDLEGGDIGIQTD